MRAIFFLPIIVTAGVVAEIIKADMSSIVALPAAGASNIFDVTILTQFLLESGLPNGLVDILTGMIANVADLVWKSGIQILIFMAALLSIPSSFYEVAQVEGASGWETFWKITFPTVSPFVLATIVYTIIDSFTSYDNQAMRYIRDYFMKDMNYSYGRGHGLDVLPAGANHPGARRPPLPPDAFSKRTLKEGSASMARKKNRRELPDLRSIQISPAYYAGNAWAICCAGCFCWPSRLLSCTPCCIW